MSVHTGMFALKQLCLCMQYWSSYKALTTPFSFSRGMCMGKSVCVCVCISVCICVHGQIMRWISTPVVVRIFYINKHFFRLKISLQESFMFNESSLCSSRLERWMNPNFFFFIMFFFPWHFPTFPYHNAYPFQLPLLLPIPTVPAMHKKRCESIWDMM